MAYKFQLGPAILSGNLEQEGDITIDGGDLRMGSDVAVAQNRNAFLSVVSASALVDSSLTAGRVAFVGADGRLVDSGDLLWDGADLDALAGRMRAADMSASADMLAGRDMVAGRDVTAGRNLVASVSASAAHISSSGGLEGILSAASLRERDTDDLAEGSSNQYFTQPRARGSISVTDAGGDGSLSYQAGTGVITYTGPSAAETRAHFSGGEMITITDGEVAIDASVFSASSDVRFDAKMAAADTDDLSEGSSNLYFTDARARAAVSVTDAGGDGSLAYNSSTGVITYTGPSAAEVRAHFTAGDGLAVAAGDFSVNVDDSSIEIDSDALQVKALGITNAMLSGAIASSKIAELNSFDTDGLSEGSSNLYFTDARARAAVSVTDAGGDGSLAYNSSTGVITYTGPSAAEVRAHFSGGEMIDLSSGVISINGTAFSGSWDDVLATKDTDDLAEGNNLYFTNARARAAISVTDAGGDGSLAYDNSTGVITYTGPSASEVRAHFSVADTDSMDMTFDAVNGEFSADLKLNSGDGQNSFEIVSGGLRLKADVAGSGLSLSGGVLSVDGGAQNAIGDANGNLAVGFNYGSADLTADRTWSLPASPSAGDVVHVKAPLVGSNKIVVAAGAGDSIDGVASIEIESDQGAVSLMAISDGAWKIF
jgi:hypothetical protein